MNFTPQDVSRIAASIRLAGEMLEAHGTRALAATPGWSHGPKSATLDPTARGNPPDPDNGIVPDRDRDTAARLRHLIVTLDARSVELRRILHAAAGTAIESPDPDTPAQVSAAGWCVSCWRDLHQDGSHWCEPVAMRPDGRRRYKDLCSWCGEWQAGRTALEQQILEPLIDGLGNSRARKDARRRLKSMDRTKPPLELVEARHRGERITQQLVSQALRNLLLNTPDEAKVA